MGALEPTHWYFNVLFLFFLQISLIYYCGIYPFEYKKGGFPGSAMDINLHGISFIVVLLDNIMSAIPVRLLHVIYPIIVNAIYNGFMLIYFSKEQEDTPYVRLIDWSQPGITTGVNFLFYLVVLPLIQLTWFAIHRLKLRVFHTMHGYSYETN